MRDGTATETHKENGSASNNKQKAVKSCNGGRNARWTTSRLAFCLAKLPWYT